MKERLKTLRGDLTFEQLAVELNKTGMKFDKSKLSKYERGDMKPATDFYTAIAILGYNVNWLLTGEGNMKISDCSKTAEFEKEIKRLKSENEVVKKMVGYEAVEYISSQFSLNDKPKKGTKYRSKSKG